MRVWNSLAGACASVVTRAVPSYQVIGLGNLGGPAGAVERAVGQSCGLAVLVVALLCCRALAHLRRGGGSLIELAGLPLSMQHYATGINNSGTIAGASGEVAGHGNTATGAMRAFVSSNGQLQ